METAATAKNVGMPTTQPNQAMARGMARMPPPTMTRMRCMLPITQLPAGMQRAAGQQTRPASHVSPQVPAREIVGGGRAGVQASKARTLPCCRRWRALAVVHVTLLVCDVHFSARGSARLDTDSGIRRLVTENPCTL